MSWLTELKDISRTKPSSCVGYQATSVSMKIKKQTKKSQQVNPPGTKIQHTDLKPGICNFINNKSLKMWNGCKSNNLQYTISYL